MSSHEWSKMCRHASELLHRELELVNRKRKFLGFHRHSCYAYSAKDIGFRTGKRDALSPKTALLEYVTSLAFIPGAAEGRSEQDARNVESHA